jgi:hypothetical protein
MKPPKTATDNINGASPATPESSKPKKGPRTYTEVEIQELRRIAMNKVRYGRYGSYPCSGPGRPFHAHDLARLIEDEVRFLMQTNRTAFDILKGERLSKLED